MISFSARKVFLAALLLAVVAAGCNLGVPENPIETDWCYTFNFLESDYGATISAGFWESGVGFYDDETGHLDLLYTHDGYVQPAQIIVTASRHDGITGDINVSGSGTVFGIDIAFSGTLPDGFDTTQQAFSPASSSENGQTASISIQTSNTLDLISLTVYGNGVNPFPFNSCGEPTPEPSLTATSTITPSWSPSPTPTCPPVPYFNSGNGHWEFYEDFEPDCPMGLHRILSGTITSAAARNGVGGLRGGTGTPGVTQVQVFIDPSWTLFGVSTWLRRNGGTTYSYYVNYYNSIGTLLYHDDIGGVIGTGAFVSRTSFPWGGGGTTGVAEIIIEADINGGGTFDFDDITVALNDEPPDFTPTMSVTPTPSNTPTPTWFLSPTPTPEPTDTRTPIIVASPTNSPIPGTATNTSVPGPTSTLTDFPTLVPFPTAIPTPTGGGNEEDTGEINILNAIGEFFAWVINTASNFFIWLGSFAGWLGGIISNVITLVGNLLQSILSFIQFIINLINEIIAIIELVIAIVGHLIDLFSLWLEQLIALVQTILAAWYGTFPTPIPGLPYCMTAPMDSDACAIFYLADNTIFSGVVGSAIMLVILVIIDLGTIFYFVRTVRNLIRRAEGLTRT